MAEKLRDGIGRELRYMEYKFRKRRTDQQKVKKKVKENQYGKNYPTMSEFSSEQLSPDIAEAVPSNTGEEQLQLQVALAMSREDASEQEKAQQSDKIRLELALKESQKAAAVTNTSPTHPVNGSVDPWGQPAAKPQNNADLFGGSTTNGFESNAWEVPSSNANNSLFQAAPPQQTNNTWVAPSTGLLPPPMKSPVRQNSPWGAAPAQAPAAAPAPVQAPPPDLWGAAPASQPQVDPWGSNQQPPQAPIDPWANMSAPSTAPQPQVDPWGTSTTQPIPNPWDQAPTSNTMSAPANQTQPSPVDDFSNLHIEEPATKPRSAADLLMGDIMLPQAPGSKPTQTDFNENQVNGKSQAAGAFLGQGASLINIDNLVTKAPSTNPYLMTSSTAGSYGNSRNPFNQKGPSLSLNQLRVEKTSDFTAGPTATPQPTNPTPLTLPVGGYPMVPGMQPVYGNMMTPQNQFPMQPAPTANFQPNQSLF